MLPSDILAGRRSVGRALMGLQAIGLVFIATAAVSGSASIPTPPPVVATVVIANLVAATLYLRGYESARLIVILTYALGCGLLMPEPFVTQYGALTLLIAPVMALVLAGPRILIGVSVVQILILLIRAEWQGVYAAPLTLAIYATIVGGMTLSQILTAIVVRSATASARRAEALAEDARRAEVTERRHAARAEALVRVAGRLNTEHDLDAVVRAVCEEATQALHVSSAVVYLLDDHQQDLRLAGGWNPFPRVDQDEPPIPRSVIDAMLADAGRVLLISDVQSLQGLPNLALYQRHGVRSVAAAALRREGSLVGLLAAATYDAPRDFSEDDTALLRGLADQAAIAIANARLHADVARHLHNVQALRTIDVAITTTHDLRFTLDVVLSQVIERLAVDAADILLLDQHDQTLIFSVGRGFLTDALRHTRLPLGKGFAGQAALQRRVIAVPDIRHSPGGLARAPLLDRERFVAYFGVPLTVAGQVKGVLEIFHRSPANRGPEWLAFLETLAGQAAIAIDNAEMFDRLRQANIDLTSAYDATIEGWSRALDLRDRETEGHSRRVTEMTLHLAQMMGLPDPQLVHIRRGALLHDIGKMGIPDSILLKPGRLTEDEWRVMQRHPTYAYDLLAPIGFLRPALDIPYCHHEKWNGSGYPRGLRGDQIPVEARIFAVADVWDALSQDRPYRKAWSHAEVLDHIRAQAGTHFDPLVVEAFLDHISPLERNRA